MRQQSTSVRALLDEKTTGRDVTITGWINHKRKLKNATFLDVTDGSTYQSLQVVVGTTPETYALIKNGLMIVRLLDRVYALKGL